MLHHYTVGVNRPGFDSTCCHGLHHLLFRGGGGGILHVARQNPISFFSFKDNLWDGLLFKYNYFNVRTCNQYINRLIINK